MKILQKKNLIYVFIYNNNINSKINIKENKYYKL